MPCRWVPCQQSLAAASETLTSDGDDASIGQFTSLCLTCLLHFGVKVQSNVTELFLHIADNFPLGCGCETIAMFRQNLHQILGYICALGLPLGSEVPQSAALGLDGDVKSSP